MFGFPIRDHVSCRLVLTSAETKTEASGTISCRDSALEPQLVH